MTTPLVRSPSEVHNQARGCGPGTFLAPGTFISSSHRAREAVPGGPGRERPPRWQHFPPIRAQAEWSGSELRGKTLWREGQGLGKESPRASPRHIPVGGGPLRGGGGPIFETPNVRSSEGQW